MREIKFRAKHKETGDWYYGSSLITGLYQGDNYHLPLGLFWQQIESGWLLADTVGNYTGLKDKNGKEIYEGDITNYGVVEWCECLNWDGGGSNHPGFYFKDKYEFGDRGSLSYHDGFDENIEVIGNIYENPEII